MIMSKDKLNIGLAEMLKGGVIMDVTSVDQAKIAEVLYSGTKVLPNGMNRFMVIGYPT